MFSSAYILKAPKKFHNFYLQQLKCTPKCSLIEHVDGI